MVPFIDGACDFSSNVQISKEPLEKGEEPGSIGQAAYQFFTCVNAYSHNYYMASVTKEEELEE